MSTYLVYEQLPPKATQRVSNGDGTFTISYEVNLKFRGTINCIAVDRFQIAKVKFSLANPVLEFQHKL